MTKSLRRPHGSLTSGMAAADLARAGALELIEGGRAKPASGYAHHRQAEADQKYPKRDRCTGSRQPAQLSGRRTHGSGQHRGVRLARLR